MISLTSIKRLYYVCCFNNTLEYDTIQAYSREEVDQVFPCVDTHGMDQLISVKFNHNML